MRPAGTARGFHPSLKLSADTPPHPTFPKSHPMPASYEASRLSKPEYRAPWKFPEEYL
jgi:hypothetical protein